MLQESTHFRPAARRRRHTPRPRVWFSSRPAEPDLSPKLSNAKARGTVARPSLCSLRVTNYRPGLGEGEGDGSGVGFGVGSGVGSGDGDGEGDGPAAQWLSTNRPLQPS